METYGQMCPQAKSRHYVLGLVATGSWLLVATGSWLQNLERSDLFQVCKGMVSMCAWFPPRENITGATKQ